jgi:hypothetical protein
MKQFFCVAIAALTAAVLCDVCRPDEKREEKPRFKGVELYSWKDKGGVWHFALLDGTNRLKTEDGVKSAGTQFKGAKELKKALVRLAVGEQVFWTHPIKGFEFPPQGTREEIKKAAKEAKIALTISGQEK